MINEDEVLQVKNSTKEKDAKSTTAKRQQEARMELVSVTEEEVEVEDQESLLPPEDCDIFMGDWVLDNLTHPLYKEED